MAKRAQLALFEEKKFNGRKTARAVSSRHYMHCILKTNRHVLRRHARLVRFEVDQIERRFGVRTKSLAIMTNHIHVLVRAPSRTLFAHAMRYFAGMIALKIGGGRLWTQRLWTRIVRHGRDLRGAMEYVLQNPVRAGIFEMSVDAPGAVPPILDYFTRMF